MAASVLGVLSRMRSRIFTCGSLMRVSSGGVRCHPSLVDVQSKWFSSFRNTGRLPSIMPATSLLSAGALEKRILTKFPNTYQHVVPQQTRSLIKFSLRKGKRKTVRAVVSRFYRLNWGAFIRTRAGKAKHIWKKHWRRRQRLLRHVFCNGQQNRLLNHMVTKFWKRPKFYADDPYTTYHARSNFPFRYPYR